MPPDAWTQLLARVRADLPQLLADFLGELEHHDGYSDGPVGPDDLAGTARSAFDLFLERLAGAAPSEASLAFTDALGRRRARQGVRFDRFLEAVRINFRVLWRALERAARPDLLGELVANGERVLAVVEGYATEVQRAFLDEEARLARLQRSARERAIARLFSGRGDDAELAEAGRTLGLAPDAPLELLAMDPSRATEEVRRLAATEGGRLFESGSAVHLLRARRGPVDWPAARPELRGGYVARVPGLAAVPRAAALAERLRAAAAPGELATLRTHLGALARDALAETLRDFADECLGDLATVSPEERERLRETVRVFIGNGSVQRTADAMFCHRNTVFKRLRAFEALTGLDVAVPRDAVVATVALGL